MANADPRAPRSYYSIIRERFDNCRGAKIGMWFIVFFFALALLAPFLANQKPFIWTSKDTGVTTFPFFRDFFAPSVAPEKILERSFNYALLFIIACASTRLLCRNATLKRLRPWLLAILAFALLIPFFTTQRVLDTTPYRQLAAEGKGSGFFPLIPYGPFENAFAERTPPTWWRQAKTAQGEYHWCGTDNVGRDVLVRLIHGSRVSLAVGIVSTVVSTIIGVLVGAIAGFFGGWVDNALSRIIEIVICFPGFFLILTVIALMDERSILNIILVLGLLGWTSIARLVRGEVLKQRALDYVTASIALGASSTRTIFRHILPNAISPVLVSVSFGIASSILTESGLSFLGFGVDIPTASWGELLNQAREAPHVYWWLVTFPGVPIFLVVTMYNLFGEGLRDALDPRLGKG